MVSYLISETHDMYVIKEQENTILKDKGILSSVGTGRSLNHEDAARPVFPRYKL